MYMKKKHHDAKRNNHHHAAHEERNGSSMQAGFLSFSIKNYMNKRDRMIIILIGLGVFVLVALSVFMVLRAGETNKLGLDQITPTPAKTLSAPYPTIAPEVKDATVLINRRGILPNTLEIKVNGTVGFFNEDSVGVTLQGADSRSTILNVGVVAPLDIPVVVFNTPGTYKYLNPQNPQDIAEIIVSE